MPKSSVDKGWRSSLSMRNFVRSIFSHPSKRSPSSSLKNMGVSSMTEAYFVFAVGLLLSLNSGYINGICMSGLLTDGGSHKQSVSAFTGTYTKSGLALANGEVELFRFEFKLILSFIGGAMISGLLNPKAIPHKLLPEYGPNFLLGCFCMIASSIASELHPDGRSLYYFAAVANGIQNGMTSSYSANLIRTTHLTGTSTDIGLIMGQMLRGNMKNYWKFKVLVGLATSFWCGGLISFYSASAFQSHSLLFSAALFLLIGLTHVTFVVLTEKVSFVQACLGKWKWDQMLERVDSIVKESDNGNGTTTLSGLTPEQVDNVFDQIDSDGAGEIDADELKEALEKIGIKLTMKNVVAMMNVVDEYGDGVVGREEFHTLVNATALVLRKNMRQGDGALTSRNAGDGSGKSSDSIDNSSSSSTLTALENGVDTVSEKTIPLPRTYQEALPSDKAGDRAIIVTETKHPFAVVGVNKPWEDLCGYKESEAIGKSMSNLIQGPKTDREGLKSAIDQLAKGAQRVECTTINYRKDGSMFGNFLTMGPLYDDDDDDDYGDAEMGTREASYYVGILHFVSGY